MISAKYVISVLFVALALMGCRPQPDKESHSNTLEVYSGWARPGTAGGNSAVYLTIYNGSGATDTLQKVTTGAAATASIHESYKADGLSGMRAAGNQPIAPETTLELKPGGLHIMLMDLKKPLSAGDTIGVQLQFKTAGGIQFEVPVRAP